MRRGLYRISHYPSSPTDEVAAAWLMFGKDRAVVSHESALDLFDLSDVIPNSVHLTLPRSARNLPRIPGVAVHTATEPLRPNEITTREGIRVTSVARTIVDAATTGTGPEQIELAVWQAIHRGMTTDRRLREAASSRSARVRLLIDRSLQRIEIDER